MIADDAQEAPIRDDRITTTRQAASPDTRDGQLSANVCTMYFRTGWAALRVSGMQRQKPEAAL